MARRGRQERRRHGVLHHAPGRRTRAPRDRPSAHPAGPRRAGWTPRPPRCARSTPHRESSSLATANTASPAPPAWSRRSWRSAAAASTSPATRAALSGEMNPEQLWETTLDPGNPLAPPGQADPRRQRAEETFSTLMGDLVETPPRIHPSQRAQRRQPRRVRRSMTQSPQQLKRRHPGEGRDPFIGSWG